MFRYDDFLPKEVYQQINEIKTFHPEIIESECLRRKKPGYPHSHLVFAAADHNARMINGYKDNLIGLSNRQEYISRLTRMLFSKEVDGVEASPDVLEDLIVLNYLMREIGKEDFLNGKMLVGTINRGGLKDAAWEMDDMPTCFTIKRIKKLSLDGVKFMLRINPDSEVNKNTLCYCAEAVNQAGEEKIPIFIEGLYINTIDEKYQMQTDLESLVKTVGVVSAVGSSSVGKWIELPLNPDYSTAVAASTCSFLVVPDEKMKEPLDVVKEYTAQVGTAYNVRGILLGRNVMYNDEDPLVLADAIANVWHNQTTAENALINSRQRT